jgi:8-oxo-dGTP pyrophosphatase MutT (NUDIX family)
MMKLEMSNSNKYDKVNKYKSPIKKAKTKSPTIIKQIKSPIKQLKIAKKQSRDELETKFAHKTSFDLFKRNKKRYIFEGTFDRSMRTDSWRDGKCEVDSKKEEDKSFTLVTNIKKNQTSNPDQYRQLREKAITSYGILTYTWIRNVDNNGKVNKELKFLLTQRRDTIHYMEFPRYKGSEQMVKKIITLMTKEEKKRIMNCYYSNTLVDLWFDLWINKRSKAFKKEFKSALENYKINIEKYKDLLLDDNIGLDELPWMLPKGRKHSNESELDCAKREYEEETLIPKKNISVLPMKPYEDIYIGSDGKVYRNVLFVAYLPINKYPTVVYRNSLFRKYITEETQDMKWFTFEECMTKLSETQKPILTDLNNYLNCNFLEKTAVKRSY